MIWGYFFYCKRKKDVVPAQSKKGREEKKKRKSIPVERDFRPVLIVFQGLGRRKGGSATRKNQDLDALIQGSERPGVF